MFFVRDFFRKCEQIRNLLRIFSNVLNKSLTANFILRVVVSTHLVLMLPFISEEYICAALRDSAQYVQFKKCEKHPWRSVTFSSLQLSYNTPP